MSVLPEKTVEHSSQKALRGFLRCALATAVGRRGGDRIARGRAVVQVGLAHGLAHIVGALLDADVVRVFALHPAVVRGDRVVARAGKSETTHQQHRSEKETPFGHLPPPCEEITYARQVPPRHRR